MERTILLELEQYKVMLDEELITHDQYMALEKSLLSLEVSHRIMAGMSEECLATVESEIAQVADSTVESRATYHKDSVLKIENVECFLSIFFALVAIFLVPIFFGTLGTVLGVLVRDKTRVIGSVLIVLNVGMTLLGMGVGTLSVW